MEEKIIEHKSLPYLTKHEYTKLISQRAQEIANGQPITIQNPLTSNPTELAVLEFERGTMPKKIRRVLPNGEVEIWKLSDFKN